MNKRLLLSLLAGTLILFVWNALSWMVLPFHSAALHPVPDEQMQQEGGQFRLPHDGVYHYPGLPESGTPEAMAAVQEKLRKGPRITLMVYKNGPTELFEAQRFATSVFFNMCSVALLLFVLYGQARKDKPAVITSAVALGILVATVSDFPQMNWFMFPLDYTLANVLDHIVGFTLLALFFGTYTFRK